MAQQKAISPLYAIANIDRLQVPLEYIRLLLASGIQLIQLRSKGQSSKEFAKLARSAVILRDELCANARLIINDDPEICAAVAADGVHLGQGDQDPRSAREMLGPEACIGLSTHTLAQISDAPTDCLDYLALGPIFPSPTKVGHAEIVGLETLARACRISPLPLVAIGGINTQNARAVYQTGVSSIAVISELQNAEDMSSTVAQFSRASRGEIRD